MALRALAVWFGILMLAVLNGGVRDTWLSPRLGDAVGRAISTLLLCGLIVLATWLTIRWIGPATRNEALRVGALWAALTLAFEFGVGHYGFRKPWPELLADYDLSRGRIWIAALVVTLFAPWWTARRRGLLGPGRVPAHGR
ncbi:hypothetical protein BH24GEM1_BH24GEM1_13570 [soil metagenome]